MKELANELFEIYQNLALTEDDKKTAQDFNLRELEIEFAKSYVQNSDYTLDIGCGIGYTTQLYGAIAPGKIVGLDYSPNMIKVAQEKKLSNPDAKNIDFVCQSVLKTNFEDSIFDLVISHRCLMALLDWELQQQALKELARILKIGGHLVLFEGTVQGLEKLNLLRGSFGLNSIDGSGKEGLFTLKFDEVKLNKFLQSDFELITESGFGTYYFLTRVFYPLHIAPNKPVFDNEFGGTARLIAEKFPNLIDIGHLKAFVLRKR